jgi:flagellar biosynthesis/type III secretory pathway protein FliH
MSIPEQHRRSLLNQGYPEAYAEGFRDGEATGRHITGQYLTPHRIDEKRYYSVEEYRKGWDAGFEAGMATARPAS